jgi:hypothetical protein
VAVLGEVRRFDATRDRLPAVEEKDFHGNFGKYRSANAPE